MTDDYHNLAVTPFTCRSASTIAIGCHEQSSHREGHPVSHDLALGPRVPSVFRESREDKGN